MTNMLITQDRLVTLIQCIKSSKITKTDSRNRFRNNRDLSFEFRSKSTKQRSHRDNTMSNRTDQTDNSISENRNDEIIKLFLKKINK